MFHLNPDSLQKINADLESEIAERKRAEASLRLLNKELETRVAERTTALEAANEALSKEVEERKQAEERFRIVVESIPTALVMVNEAGEILLVNAQTEHLFGYSREELQGQSIEILIPERFQDTHTGHRRDYLEEPGTRPMGAGRDLYGLHKDGHEFPVEVGLNPVMMGEKILIMGAIMDISIRKEAEAVFKKYAAALERSNQELDQFASIASHDLREPLRTITGFIHLLQKKIPGPDR